MSALREGYSDHTAQQPIDMVLHCPECSTQHIDIDETNNRMHSPGCNLSCGMPAKGCSCEFSSLWSNPPHRSHQCHKCGHIWRPADVPTNGVLAVKTKGKNDSPVPATADLCTRRSVDDLQRELLAICKGGRYADEWRKLNAPTEWPSFKGELSKLCRVDELRKQIKALNPKAVLYYGWAGPGDVRPKD